MRLSQIANNKQNVSITEMTLAICGEGDTFLKVTAYAENTQNRKCMEKTLSAVQE